MAIIMVSHKYEEVMRKTEQVEAYQLFLRDWKIPEIATELGKSTATIRNWSNKYDWRTRKMFDLRDIEDEMREKVQKAREQILDISTQTLSDVFVRDQEGNVIGVNIIVEDVKDLRTIAETILKTGGVPEKIESKVEKIVDGNVTIQTETIDPKTAAEIGKVLALKQSRGE